MTKEVKEAINTLVKKAQDSHNADAALKYSQAALNTAHVAAVLNEIEKRKFN